MLSVHTPPIAVHILCWLDLVELHGPDPALVSFSAEGREGGALCACSALHASKLQHNPECRAQGSETVGIGKLCALPVRCKRTLATHNLSPPSAPLSTHPVCTPFPFNLCLSAGTLT